jgi:uncharacterized repeat protein (TIGR01451 family)
LITRNNFGAAALSAMLLFAPLTTVRAGAPASATLLDPDALLNVSVAQDDEPSDAEQNMFTKGQGLYIQGRYEQAVSVLRDFLKNYPNSVITDLTLLWLGRSYMQLGRLQEAEQIGQRLRAIRDTPFIDIYDSELQAARTDRRTPVNSPPATEPRTTATTPSEVASTTATTTAPVAPRSTPASRTPTLIVRPTPTPEVARGPSLAERRAAARAERRRRAQENAARTAATAPTTTAAQPSALASNATANPVVPRQAPPTTSRQPARQSQRNTAAGQQIASNTQPARTNTTTRTTTPPAVRPPVAAPSPVATRPVETSSDPALSTATTTAPVTTPLSQPVDTQTPPSSGSLSFTVKQVPNLNLALRRPALAASPGQQVQLPLTVTNTGNKEDQFRLETDLPAEYQPTFSLAQGGSDTGLPILITRQLARGESLEVLLNVRIPDAAPDNQQRKFFVRAASQSNNEIQRIEDASLTVVAASLAATTGVSQETVMPGETFTQTISVRNQGSATAKSARADFVFNPDFELVSANPSPLVYDRASRTAIWSLGDVDSRGGRDISVTLRAVPDALANTRTLGRGTMRTASLIVPSNFDGPSVNVGRVTRARIDSVSSGLTATPGDTVYIPFVVRNPGNYNESFDLRITAPGAPAGTIYADTNGDGRHQDSEPAVTQTTPVDARGGQFPLLLRVDIPRSTADRQQYAYNVVVRSLLSSNVASEAATVLTVAAPRVRVRSEQGTGEVSPGDTFFYRLVLVNDGGGLAKNLIVNESLPSALEFVSSDPSLSTSDAAGGAQRFTWRVAELAPGDTTVLLVTVRLRPNVAADQTLSPTHTLTYQDTNGNSYTGR